MKYLRKFESFLNEDMSAPTTAPTRPTTKPNAPTKPVKPTRPVKPIVRPSVDPEIKDVVTELDVAHRFIVELNNRGESVSDYING